MKDFPTAHIGLNCRNPEATERFYVRYFGFVRSRVLRAGNDSSIVFLRRNDFMLELFAAKDGVNVPTPEQDGPSGPGFRHLALEVDSVDKILFEMGPAARISMGPVDLSPDNPGWRIVWIRDPEENILELYQGYTDQFISNKEGKYEN